MDVRYPTSPLDRRLFYFQLRHLYPKNAKFDSLFFFPFLATLYNTIYQHVLNSPHIAERSAQLDTDAFSRRGDLTAELEAHGSLTLGTFGFYRMGARSRNAR